MSKLGEHVGHWERDRDKQVQIIRRKINGVHNQGGNWGGKHGNGVGSTHKSSWAGLLKGIGTFDWISKM